MRQALALDEGLAEIYNPLAGMELYYRRDWPAAERAFRKSIELDPNFADTPHHYALCLSLFARNEEALAQFQRAAELNPFFPGLTLHYGRLFFFLHDYDRAIKEYVTTLELHPGYAAAHEWFGDACAKKGMRSEAIIQWRAALALSGETEQAAILERTYQESGFEAAVRALAQDRLRKLDDRTARGDYVPAMQYLMAYVRSGDYEKAFVWLEKTVAERNWFAFETRVNPILDDLRKDPRFEEIVASLAHTRRTE